MLNIGRFMLSTSIMCSFNTTMSSNRFYNNPDINSYLARLLEKDSYIDFQKEDSTTKKINPRMVFTFYKNNLKIFEQLKKFIGSEFLKQDLVIL